MTRYLFYDGDCGICQKFVDTIAPLRATRRVKVEPYQGLDEAFKQAHKLSDASFEKGMYFLDTETGQVSHGALAFNRFFLQFPPYRYFIWLLYIIPVFLLAEVLVYNLVARNRAAISQRLGLTACKIR